MRRAVAQRLVVIRPSLRCKSVRMECRNGHDRKHSYRGWGGRLLCRPCDKARDDRWRSTAAGRAAKSAQATRWHYKTRRWRALDQEKARIQQRLTELDGELMNLA